MRTFALRLGMIALGLVAAACSTDVAEDSAS
jgi:hypothetical protein